MRNKFKTGDKIRLLRKPFDWFNKVRGNPGMDFRMYGMVAAKEVVAVVDTEDNWNNWLSVSIDGGKIADYAWSQEWFELAGPREPITHEEFLGMRKKRKK